MEALNQDWCSSKARYRVTVLKEDGDLEVAEFDQNGVILVKFRALGYKQDSYLCVIVISVHMCIYRARQPWFLQVMCLFRY